MLRVVLDTNVVSQDYLFRRSSSLFLLAEAQRERLTLVLPEIVLRETANRYRGAIEDALTTATGVERHLSGLGVLPTAYVPPDVNAESEASDYYWRRVRLPYAQTPSIPEVDHQSIVARALARKQPFDGNGQDGYPDVLLWESVMALLNDDNASPVVLVSNDKRAFGEGRKEPVLAEDLRREVIERFGPRATVELQPGLREFIEAHLKPDTALRDRLRREVATGQLTAAVQDSLAHSEPENYVWLSWIPFGFSACSPTSTRATSESGTREPRRTRQPCSPLTPTRNSTRISPGCRHRQARPSTQRTSPMNCPMTILGTTSSRSTARPHWSSRGHTDKTHASSRTSLGWKSLSARAPSRERSKDAEALASI
jgi:hypothetical protein